MSQQIASMTHDEKVAWKKLQREFVLNSEQISGRGYDGTDKYWEQDGVKRHLELAEILNKSGCRYVGASLINATLTGRFNSWYRTGVEGMSKGLVPDGEHVPGLVDGLNDEVNAALVSMKGAVEREQDDFAWSAHDKLMCYNAFKSGNGRTARLLYGHIRTLFGLGTFIIKYDKSTEYFANLQRYKQDVFLPQLRASQQAA